MKGDCPNQHFGGLDFFGESTFSGNLFFREIQFFDGFWKNSYSASPLPFRQYGERIYLPSKNKVLDGIRINSPFYLAKLKIPKTDQVERYTLVVSEYEKTHDITFTIEGKFKNISSFSKISNFLNS